MTNKHISKAFSLLLACLLALTMAACGNQQTTGREGDQVQADAKPQDVPDDSSEDEWIQSLIPGCTIDEQVIVNQDSIIIKAVSLTADRPNSKPDTVWYSLNCTIENYTNKDLLVTTTGFCVNGAMIDALLFGHVGPGESVTEGCTFYPEDLERAGISVIKEMELRFRVDDYNSIETVMLSERCVVTTSAKLREEQVFDSSGDVIFDDRGVKIVMQGYEVNPSEEEYSCSAVFLYIENNTGESIIIYPQNSSLNGFMIEAIMFCEVFEGKVAFASMKFYNDELAKCGIADFEVMELSFHVVRADDWSTIFDTEMITVVF